MSGKRGEDQRKMEKMTASKLIYEEESYAINGACFAVYKDKGCGFLEAVYQECLEMEFAARNIPFLRQRQLPLTYRGRPLKQVYVADFVCYDKIVVELKAVSQLTSEHKAQVMNYLKATGYKLGLLINFGHYPLLEKVRIANSKEEILNAKGRRENSERGICRKSGIPGRH